MFLLIANFSVKKVFLVKLDRKRFPQKNPPHASPSKSSKFITINFWDHFYTRKIDQ